MFTKCSFLHLEQEIQAPGSPLQEDTCYAPSSHHRREGQEDLQGIEEKPGLPHAQIRSQGLNHALDFFAFGLITL